MEYLNKKVPFAVIKRLPRYYRHLNELIQNDVDRTSSGELSKRMGSTASQIRQDLNCFARFGQQGYGYNVRYLHDEIAKILGIKKGYSTIIMGMGNLGTALANYTNFENRGFRHIGMFDIDRNIVGKVVRGVKIQHVDELDSFVKEHKPDIGILTVPKDAIKSTAVKLASLGIKGLWNFSYVDLGELKDVSVESVHLSDSLMTLAYKINNFERNNEID